MLPDERGANAESAERRQRPPSRAARARMPIVGDNASSRARVMTGASVDSGASGSTASCTPLRAVDAWDVGGGQELTVERAVLAGHPVDGLDPSGHRAVVCYLS